MAALADAVNAAQSAALLPGATAAAAAAVAATMLGNALQGPRTMVTFQHRRNGLDKQLFAGIEGHAKLCEHMFDICSRLLKYAAVMEHPLQHLEANDAQFDTVGDAAVWAAFQLANALAARLLLILQLFPGASDADAGAHVEAARPLLHALALYPGALKSIVGREDMQLRVPEDMMSLMPRIAKLLQCAAAVAAKAPDPSQQLVHDLYFAAAHALASVTEFSMQGKQCRALTSDTCTLSAMVRCSFTAHLLAHSEWLCTEEHGHSAA